MIKSQKPETVEITVEELTVYRYHVILTDDVEDPGAVALERFRSGESPDAGPAEGEQHELTTYFVGEVQTPVAPWEDAAEITCES